jgi:hypothetical protein
MPNSKQPCSTFCPRSNSHSTPKKAGCGQLLLFDVDQSRRNAPLLACKRVIDMAMGNAQFIDNVLTPYLC